MKFSFVSSIVSVIFLATVGCNSLPYTPVKTGPDQYSLHGSDQNHLKSNAYQACVNDGFDDYSVVENNYNGMTVHCEKSLSMQAKETWTAAKQQVKEIRKDMTSR